MKTHTFFLKILSWNEAKMGFEDGDTECLGTKQLKEKMNSHIKFEGKLKMVLKIALIVQNTRFRDWGKSPKTPAKTLQAKRFENFAKCFSRLEVSLTRESRAEPRKSLCTPRYWTFHSWTSRQNWPVSSRLWHATWLTRDWVAKIGKHCFWNFQFLRE